MLIRRGWILLLGLLIGVAIGWVVTGISVSASNAFEVKAKGVNQTPYQSDRLALTYARLLSEETSVQHLVAAEIGRSNDYVQHHLSMSAQAATPVVFARFSAASSEAALAGLHALTVALLKGSDSAGSRLRATVIPLSEPSLSTGFSRSKALLLGAAGGLLIALALVLTLERRDPRIDDLGDLASILAIPVSRATQQSLAAAIASPAQGCTGAPIELVTVDESRFDESRLGGSPARMGLLPDSIAPPAVAAAQADGPDAAGRCPNRALVVKRGTSVADVRDVYRLSLLTGPPIVTALLLNPRPLWSRAVGLRHGVRAA